jgi:hypothetical protein
MGNEHIKNSVVVVSVRSGNCVQCKQYYKYDQNYICNRNTTEVQNFKIAIDQEDKCINMRQRNMARNFNINNTTEGHNNQDLSLTQALPHNHSIEIYHKNTRSLRNKINELLCHLHQDSPHT